VAGGTISPSPRRRELLGLGVAYAALALWWHWPLPRLMQEHALYADTGVAVVPADIYLTLWILAWGAHALVTQPWALFNANSFYPSTLSLAYAEHLLGYVPMFGPFYWTTDNRSSR
jgi:hypothetical protein